MTDKKLFAYATDRLWGSITRRHSAGGRRKYGPVPITKAEFRAWLLEQSIDGRGLAWKCAYTGNIVTSMGKKMDALMTVDHQVPIASGGSSHTANLAVVSKEANLIKGAMSFGFYSRLMDFMSTWPAEERNDVLKRLKGFRPGWGR
jgi:hypothetical protein